MNVIYSSLIALFAFCSFAFAQTQSIDKTTAPAVVKAVAPNAYPVAAVAVKAEGEVKVKVKINKDGNVESTEILSGNPLLKRISEIAAIRWKFVPSSEEKERFAEISFIYRIVSDEKDAQTSFNPPYQVIFIYSPLKLVISPSIDPRSIDKKNK